jgi:uncharacterized protein (DUF1697 family)
VARQIAFLRAINVGGHRVTMGDLARVFERLGFRDVQTFIASGNVIFSGGRGSVPALERRIERALEAALGYEVATFIRSDAEVATVARYRPFETAAMAQALSLNVGFTSVPLTAEQRRVLASLETANDAFHVNGREIYWKILSRQSESVVSNAVIERALRIRSTFRGAKTIEKLAAKLAG